MDYSKLKAIVEEMTEHLEGGCACCQTREWKDRLEELLDKCEHCQAVAGDNHESDCVVLL